MLAYVLSGSASVPLIHALSGSSVGELISALSFTGVGVPHLLLPLTMNGVCVRDALGTVVWPRCALELFPVWKHWQRSTKLCCWEIVDFMYRATIGFNTCLYCFDSCLS